MVTSSRESTMFTISIEVIKLRQSRCKRTLGVESMESVCGNCGSPLHDVYEFVFHRSAGLRGRSNSQVFTDCTWNYRGLLRNAWTPVCFGRERREAITTAQGSRSSGEVGFL